ncbi:DNA ligase D [Brevundimonas sp. 2R-24]|uniref:DNA ligase (ATP) n=1 Tax=Peiella sedimenti TaxID=3061083 RepID=A0ABT8SL63_9CAUL|nr:DNA ligase D [Caulobacteraceae bacterium XZ-24]
MGAQGELDTYRKKRDFKATPEPAGRKGAPRKSGLRYLIQRHAATRLHYDFRIEHDGVLKSWAVTKAPSRDPSVKRLAVEVEDHPLDYGGFEGTIPSGNYGAGTVQMWDEGVWEPRDGQDVGEALEKGSLKMVLHGERLSGGWALVRLKADRGKPSKRNNWLLIKERDAEAVDGEGDANMEIDASVTTGRTLAEIAEGRKTWKSSKGTTRKAPAKPKPTQGQTQGASKPSAFLPIQLCKLADHPPSGAGWAHEIKFDGYRIQIAVGGGRAILRTRKGLDWSDKFPELAAEAAKWPDGVIDGELCALDETSAPDFSALQAAIADGRTGELIFFAFDLLSEGQEDLRKKPLSHRKARLQAYVDHVGKAGPRLRYVDHFAVPGEAVLRSACRMDLEGVISKRLDAAYQGGRSTSWVKSKCRGRDEVIIGGWSSEGGARLRSLLVGVREKDGLRYLGRIGTGFGALAAKTLVPALKGAATEKSPFSGKGAPRGGRDIHWVKPILVAEVEHGGYTDTGSLRQAAFKGLRDDKPAEDVTDRPQAPSSATSAEPAGKKGKVIIQAVTLSNPDKPLWPAEGAQPAITKADLARYMEQAAPRLLPHVADRPVSIIRAPEGIEGERFFQRHPMTGSSPRLKLIDVKERKPYIAVTDVGGLVAIAQSGGLELHPWGCKPGDPDTPEQVTMDLDPDEGLDFNDVIAAAHDVRDQVEALGLAAFVKTTGGKGLHVVIPIKADKKSAVTWEACKAFAKALAEKTRKDAPDRYTTTLSKKARGGKIFVDYLRNGRMATAVAPWSPRARPGATIAFPLDWKQVKPGLDPKAYTILTAPDLLKKPDPWADFRKAEKPLRSAMKKLGL